MGTFAGFIIVSGVALLIMFILYLGHIGMTYRLGIHYANILAIAGFFLCGLTWIPFIFYAPDGWLLWRAERRARRAHHHVEHHATPRSADELNHRP